MKMRDAVIGISLLFFGLLIWSIDDWSGKIGKSKCMGLAHGLGAYDILNI